MLVYSSDWLIRSAEKIGVALRFPRTIIGLTILAFGTSLPELAFSLAGTLEKMPVIVISNVVGSNIVNVLFVLGILGLLAPKLLSFKFKFMDSLLLFIATVVFTLLVLDREISFIDGIVLLITLGGTLFFLFQQHNHKTEKTNQPLPLAAFVLFIISMAVIGLSAYGVVLAISTLATLHQVSSTLLTVTVVALGTSLPELVVSLVALIKKEVDISLGNIIGSNIFNLLFVVAVPSLFSTLPIDAFVFSYALPVMLLATIALIFLLMQRHIMRWQALLLVLFYIVFLFISWG